MEKDDDKPLTTAEKAARGVKAFLDNAASVSYAGNHVPNIADADPDNETPGDEEEEEPRKSDSF